MKFRAYDGSRRFPALALGYDGQGYFFNKNTHKYDQREKGLYTAASGEVIVPEFVMSGGLNIFDFNNDHIYGFAGMAYTFQNRVGIMFEADNLFHEPRQSRFNIGLRCRITDGFSMDLAKRDLWAAGRKPENTLRFTYSRSFWIPAPPAKESPPPPPPPRTPKVRVPSKPSPSVDRKAGALEHYKKGLVYYSQGELDKAMEEWRAALKEDPGLSRAREALRQAEAERRLR
jgi:tetratricopeptide (TPR) repeat protein